MVSHWSTSMVRRRVIIVVLLRCGLLVTSLLSTTSMALTSNSTDHSPSSSSSSSSSSSTSSFLPTKYTSTPPRDQTAYLWSSLLAGVGSGALASIACAPLDLLRTRLQVGGPTTLSASRLLLDILKTDGYTGVFRGLGATLATVPLFWGLYFPLYDEIKRRLSEKNHLHHSDQHQYPYQFHLSPALTHCVSAIAAGAIADVICNPLFLVRTRLQTAALHQHQHSHHPHHQPLGMISTFRQLYQQGGISIFWRGISASLFGLSHVAVQFPVYEWIKEYFQTQQQNGPHKRQDCTSMEILLASGASKMCASLLTYPHEVLRSKMMDSRTSTTLLQTIQTIWKLEGPRGFYSGIQISLLRVVPNCCITFLSYEMFLRFAKEQLEMRYRQ